MYVCMNVSKIVILCLEDPTVESQAKSFSDIFRQLLSLSFIC